MRIIAVIPARYDSSRFPGKPLIDLCGKPMIQHVYERSIRCDMFDRVIIATDDSRIYDVVKKFGGEVQMTPPCSSGCDRCAHVALTQECDIVVNIQGDEPLIENEMLNTVVQPFFEEDNIQLSTLKYPIENEKDYLDPSVVKVVTDINGFALCFSRSPIPHYPDIAWERAVEFPDEPFPECYWHIGIYAYTRDILLKFAKWDRTLCERAEELQQLRFMENGVRWRVIDSKSACVGINTPKDVDRVIEIMKRNNPSSNIYNYGSEVAYVDN